MFPRLLVLRREPVAGSAVGLLPAPVAVARERDAFRFEFVDDAGYERRRALVNSVEKVWLDHAESSGGKPLFEAEAVAINVPGEIAVKGLRLQLAKPGLARFVPLEFLGPRGP
jgi:hypothetical protein